MKNLKDKIIGLLFYESDGISLDEICTLLEVEKDEVVSVIEDLKKDYEENSTSLKLLSQNNNYQLVLDGEVRDIILQRDYKDRKTELTKATLETLSCVIYLRQATKSQIDYIRGIQSSYSLRVLVSRGLLSRVSRGRDTLYTPTIETLRFMGLGKVEDMPDFEKINQELTDSISTQKEDLE